MANFGATREDLLRYKTLILSGTMAAPPTTDYFVVDGDLYYWSAGNWVQKPDVNNDVGGKVPLLATQDQAAAFLSLGIAVSTYGFPDAMRASDGYFLRFIAPRTPASADKKAWDNSGNRNDGVFQNHLTAAAAWATAGALTQKNPDTSGEQTLVSFPACNFDLLGGESLLIFWKGRATPEGTDQALMANTVNETTANGFRVVCRSTGQVGFNGYQFSGGISASAPNASTVCFSATVTNSFAICLTGAAGPLTGACNIRIFVGGVPDGATGYTNGFQPFHSGVLMDLAQPTQNFLLGGNGATSGGIQFGVACQTEALHVLKGRVGLGAPLNLTQLVADLHRDPSRLVLASEW